MRTNQAIAAGRLWSRRSPGAKLIGRIGEDVFGANLLAALEAGQRLPAVIRGGAGLYYNDIIDANVLFPQSVLSIATIAVDNTPVRYDARCS